jgi:hypothetical protein
MVKLDVEHAEIGDLTVKDFMNGRHVESPPSQFWNRARSAAGIVCFVPALGCANSAGLCRLQGRTTKFVSIFNLELL